MLERLTIQNYALIENLDIEFPDGLVIITGETGAGKSILLGAVSLLSGGKVEPSVLRDDKKNCVVEAVFSSECGQTILRRVISPSLRSRFFIDDEPVPAARMGEVSASLFDVHTQHSNLLLGNADFQKQMLDAFCGNSKLLEEYKAESDTVRNIAHALSVVKEKILQAENEFDSRRSDLQKLEDAALVDGELEALEQEQKRLENANILKENSMLAVSLLDGTENSIVHNLREAARNVQKCASFAQELESLVSRLESCRIECKDISSDLEQFTEDIQASPIRLRQVEERLGVLYSLMKRYSCGSVEELVSLRDSLKNSEAGIGDLELERDRLAKEMDVHYTNRSVLAKKLTSRRTKGAEGMQKRLLPKIRSLEMPSSALAIEVIDEGLYTSDGQDRIRILFSANPNERMVELDKVASGGELSRIMLCFKSLMANYMKMPTMFFDEIDVGVSGSVADKMGQLIVEMGRKMQVISITHLPQVASKGNAHLLVSKGTGADGRNTVHLKFLDHEQRIMEIARLLSGEKTTAQAIENAKVLLDTKN